MKIKLNSAGIRQLLHEPGVQADLKARAERVAASAGANLNESDGMGITEAGDTKRARYVVITVTNEAKAAEARDRVLTQAIDAAR